MFSVTSDDGATTREASIGAIASDLLKTSLDDLRLKWRNAHPGVPLPKDLPRDLLVRDIAWAEQCRRCGGMDPTSQRLLDKMARQLKASGTLEIERCVRPKIGTRIIREWRGRTYVVEVADDGFLFDGNNFASLSHVARAITGTRWSGPRFFGLKPEQPAADAVGEG